MRSFFKHILCVSVSVSLLVSCSNTNSVLLPQGITLVEQQGAISHNSDRVVIEYQKYQLDNGLTLILQPDSSTPLVHVDVTYHVGSNREDIGKSGFAHFFEHMMFQGSKHVGDQQHFKIVQEAGGSMNGSTTKDRTNYYQTVPANQLEKVLWLESDRMGFLLEAVSQEKFEIQRETVKNERAQRVDNAPYGLISERVGEALYPREHPYSWQPIGYIEDLNRVQVQDLKDFFLRWYGPNNAVLTIGGDFDPEQTLAWVNTYFSGIPSGPDVSNPTPNVPVLDESRYISLEDKIASPMLYMQYPTTVMGSEDEIYLDMFADILGGGKSSILYQNLVKTGLANSAGAYHRCEELSCSLVVYADANPSVNPKLSDMLELVDASIEQFAQRGVSEADVQRVSESFRAAAIFNLDSVSGKVGLLALGETFKQDPQFVLKQISNYQKVSNQDVQNAYQTFVQDKPRVLLSLVPKGKLEWQIQESNYSPQPRNLPPYQSVAEDELVYREAIDPTSLDRSIMPAAGDPVSVKVPSFWNASLNNGLAIMASSEQSNPTTSIEIQIPGGSLAEDPEHYGLARLTASLLNQSSQLRGAETIADELEALGSNVGFSSGLYTQTIELESLSENLDRSIEILVERLLKPAFDSQEFEVLRSRHLQSMQQKQQRPSWLANIKIQSLIYGEDSRLGSSSDGSFESVNNIDTSLIKAYWATTYRPSGANLVAVSNLDQQQLMSALKPLEAWMGEAKQMERFEANYPSKGGKLYLIDRPGSVQSVLRISRPALPYDATGELYLASLMNFNFGGNFNSRINLNLREDKGFTYGVSSGFSAFRDAGAFTIDADIRGDAIAQSIQELLNEMQRYKDTGPSQEEMDYLRSAISQQEALSYELPTQKVDFLFHMLNYQLSPSFVEEQNQIVQTVTAEQLQVLAQKYLNPDQMQFVVVGDKQQIIESLAQLPLEIIEVPSN
ncbi:insulinase family protein [Alginatibacterium sediminis]|uniref:Insulinase family protein n=1 Tax=Alginatibacterium sediminis TaxID=2164068 RepID=A0A420EA36_9ALTE|nr:pitrilysin family protein [Alginatibacterium sediminis]RKF17522.1 insulinase family protein [Alginatibacterium sediminis]